MYTPTIVDSTTAEYLIDCQYIGMQFIISDQLGLSRLVKKGRPVMRSYNILVVVLTGPIW